MIAKRLSLWGQPFSYGDVSGRFYQEVIIITNITNG